MRGPVPEGPSTYAHSLLEAAVLVALVVAPLYFNPETERVFEADKLAWLLVLGLAALWGQAARLLAEGRPGLERPSAVTLAAGAAFVVVALGTLGSVAPTLSFWGLYRRGQGLLAFVAFASLFWAALASARHPGALDRLRRVLLLTTVAASSYALLQRWGVDNIVWDASTEVAVRPFGPLGNPIFLGAWLVMTLPMLAAGLIERVAAARVGSDGHRMEQVGLALGLALGATALVVSQSRGPALGALAAGLTFCILWLATAKRFRMAAGALAAATLGAAILAASGGAGAGAGGRLAEMAWAGSRTATERLLLWESLADLSTSSGPRAAVGYGPETTPLLLAPRLPEELVRLAPDQVFDRAHNAGWEWWVAGGVGGVAAWLVLYVAAFVAGLDRLGLLSGGRQRLAAAAGLAASAGVGGVVAVVLGGGGLWSLGAAFGLVSGLLLCAVLGAAGAHRNPPPAAATKRRRGWRSRGAGADGSHGAPTGFGRWARIGVVSALVAHLVESAFGLPTAAGELLFWVLMAMVAADVAGGVGSDGARAVGEGRAGWSDGFVDGLALATVVFAPLLVGDRPGAFGAPLLWLLPVAVWVAADLASTRPSRPPWARAAARLAILTTLVVLLAVLADRPWGPGVAYLVVTAASLVGLTAALGGALPRSPAPARIAALTVLAALGLWVAWRAAVAPISADAFVRSGLEEAARGGAAAAARPFERARDLWPEQPAYALYEAAVHRERMLDAGADAAALEASFREAEAALLAADARVPDAQTALLLATLARERGDVERHPTERAVWWTRALDASRTAIDRSPTMPEPHLERGTLLERLGDSGAAEDAYRRVTEVSPARAAGWVGRARMAAARGDLDGARSMIEQGVSLAGEAGVLAVARSAVDEPTAGLAAGYTLVLALALTGDRDGAGNLLVSLRELSPDDAFARELGAWLDGERRD